jgi:CHAT domain-containing protein
VARQDLRESFLASKQPIYELYVDVLMEQASRRPGEPFAAKALEVNEQARARGLLDLLAKVGADLDRDADPLLLKREKSLRDEIGVLYQRRLKLIRDEVTDERLEEAEEATRQIDRQIDADIEELHRVNAEITLKSPHYAAFVRPEPLSVSRIQTEVLDPDSLLLEYALGDKRSWLWAVSRTAIHAFELPPRKEVEEQARLYYTQVVQQADRELSQTETTLAQMLLGPARPLLAGRRLLVVADGELQYIPFGALPLPSSGATPSRLVEQNEVVYLSSASTLAALRHEAKRPAPTQEIAAFGDPVFQEKDERLHRPPGDVRAQAAPPQQRGDAGEEAFDPSRLSRLASTRYEVESIVKLAKPGRSWKALDFQASRDAVTSGRLADYGIVHFATHGHIDNNRPELSALAFSRFNERGELLPQDGLLRLSDIYSLHLNADLVTLSACDTALGKEMKGEGLIGLTRGFMYAGSARVLASLWKVDDRETARLMERFYKALLEEHMMAPAALRQAQREALKRRPQPYYWAGFSLQGEPR